jgi:hypothetical protein
MYPASGTRQYGSVTAFREGSVLRKAIVAVLIGAVVASANPVAASAVAIVDPRDTGGRLDITFVGTKFHHVNKTFDILKIRVETEHGYACRYLRYSGRNAIFVLFDNRHDRDVDLVGRFVCNRPHSWSFVLRDVGFSTEHPDTRTVVARLDAGALSRHGSIDVRSRDETAGSCSRKHVCRDRAPNSGRLRAW